MQTYHYSVTLTDGQGRSYCVIGATEAEKGDLRTAADNALREMFGKIIGPFATVQTCGGPYTVERLEISRQLAEDS